jgi:hypothetical protein
MRLRLTAPARGLLSACIMVAMCAGVASAQPRKKAPPAPTPAPLKADKTETPPPTTAPATKKTPPTKEQNFNFGDLNLNGRSRSPQLLYFLERANEELERASLEKRSFIPHMVRTVEEEAL